MIYGGFWLQLLAWGIDIPLSDDKKREFEKYYLEIYDKFCKYSTYIKMCSALGN